LNAFAVAHTDRQQAATVVHLAGITNCDRTAISLLSGAAAVAADHGGELRLAGPSATICAWLRATDLMAGGLSSTERRGCRWYEVVASGAS
jgi:hypothetical protein